MPLVPMKSKVRQSNPWSVIRLPGFVKSSQQMRNWSKWKPAGFNIARLTVTIERSFSDVRPQLQTRCSGARPGLLV
jgi:hypothetical protein